MSEIEATGTVDRIEEEATAILKRARQHLQRGWCRDFLALDADGGAVAYNDETAVEFCAIGALERARWDLISAVPHGCQQAVRRLREVVSERAPDHWQFDRGIIVQWNNDPDRTQEEILKAFDEAAGGK